MANSEQARKRVRQNETRRQHNASLRSRMRTFMKSVLAEIANGDKAKAQAAYVTATSAIDTMVGKGLVHKNKAARHKSRLNAKVKALV